MCIRDRHEVAHSMLHDKEVNQSMDIPVKDRNTKEVEAERDVYKRQIVCYVLWKSWMTREISKAKRICSRNVPLRKRKWLQAWIQDVYKRQIKTLPIPVMGIRRSSSRRVRPRRNRGVLREP